MHNSKTLTCKRILQVIIGVAAPAPGFSLAARPRFGGVKLGPTLEKRHQERLLSLHNGTSRLFQADFLGLHIALCVIIDSGFKEHFYTDNARRYLQGPKCV